jgi:N-acetylmuramoyl-L-alanine amidase
MATTVKDLVATKLRLVREAVRDNVEGPSRSPRPKVEARPRYTLVTVLACSFLIASLVYLSMPPTVPPRVSEAAAHTPKSEAVNVAMPVAVAPAAVSASVETPLARPDVIRPTPHRPSRAVLPLSVRKIVLDPGHGGTQLGATSESGVTEKEITLDIALRLRQLLQTAQFEVLMTREMDATLSLERRASFANANHADLFVSIHVNWIPYRQVRPLETYFVGPTDDPATMRLASVENHDSGYSLASSRRLLAKIFSDARREESQALAQRLNAELYRSLREVNPALENRGVKTAPFAVLVGTEMPAILVEVSCLSNEADVDLLTTADYRDRVARALLKGIQSYATGVAGVGGKES